MKKLISMIALAAISFGSVYAAPVQQKDTTKTDTSKKMKKWKKKMKDTTKTKKDSVKM